ncbi:haloacid dehalogenase type II [Streptomyces sp. NPDC001292]|uniref:haloacid dehalogenase type II n=1 Tax=Streptomyces sp. NPDC001292 TaxID=3364558 RepID=UPI00368DBE64
MPFSRGERSDPGRCLYLFPAAPLLDLPAVGVVAAGRPADGLAMITGMLPVGITVAAVTWSWVNREERRAVNDPCSRWVVARMSPDARGLVLVFDVNETLTDMTALGARLEDAGLSVGLLPQWFAGVLRDGIALTLAGGRAPFAQVAGDGLRTLLARERPERDPEPLVEHVLAGLSELPVHPDVPGGVRALHAAGHRLATLTNGSVDTTRAVLTRAGLADCFEAHLDVQGAGGRWKPAAAAYAHALGALDVPAASALLVAVHPWDIDGASRAGLRTAWLRRTPVPYPSALRPADLEATGVTDLARRLGRSVAG